MSRNLMIKIHLVLAAVFMPLMLMMPVTGSLYILGFKGDQVTTEAFRTADPAPEDNEKLVQFFREQFSKQNIDYSFESVKANNADFSFRPSTKVHFAATRTADGVLIVSKVDPSFLKRLIELHKAHGPIAMRWFEVCFAMALVLTVFSGVWLAWTAKPYRKILLISFGIGAAVIGLCLI